MVEGGGMDDLTPAAYKSCLPDRKDRQAFSK